MDVIVIGGGVVAERRVAALLDCGANGGCVPLQESEVMCGCDDGYAGDLCDTCAPGFQMIFRGDVGGCMLIVPESDDMVLWLDADHDASFDIGPAGNVTAWRSRAGDETAFTAAGLVSGRPSRVEVGGRDWVHFDGEDDRLQRAVLEGSPDQIAVLAAAYPLLWGSLQIGTGWLSDVTGREISYGAVYTTLDRLEQKIDELSRRLGQAMPLERQTPRPPDVP